jgi:hypothetical protein
MKTTFKDHDIEVTPDFRFSVTGPLFDGAMAFSSIDDARHGISQRAVALAQQRKAEAALALDALDDEGARVTIKGIHAAQGTLLGVKGGRAVYPVLPWIRDLLIHRVGLTKELAEVERKLHPYGISARRQYGRVRPEDYEQEISKLVGELNAKTEAAKEIQNV